jgi:ADP-ribose pyrophosphatase
VALHQRPPGRQQRPATARMVFKGVLFDVWQWEQQLFDGGSALFETLSRPDTVLVLPVTSDGHVILAEETQPGMPPVLHALGGRIEPGEAPIAAGARELVEESGLAADEWRLWDAWQPLNKIDWAVYLYVAHGLRRQGSAAPDSGELISLHHIPVAELLDANLHSTPIDDYELLHKIYFARSDDHERKRVLQLLTPSKAGRPYNEEE